MITTIWNCGCSVVYEYDENENRTYHNYTVCNKHHKMIYGQTKTEVAMRLVETLDENFEKMPAV